MFESGLCRGTERGNQSESSRVETLSQMFNEGLQRDIDYRDLMSSPDVSMPPRQPGLMPRQVLVFWTPQRALQNFVHGLRELRQPPRAMQHATISVPKADEPG
jgi:hypothetical protein